MGVIIFILCMSCGHIALAYGDNTGKEVIYQSEDTERYQLKEMYLSKTEKTGTLKLRCVDEEAFHEYISNLTMSNLTGNYTFRDREKQLCFWYDTPQGEMYVKLSDDVIQILPLYEKRDRWYSYYLLEGMDWEYLEKIVIAH